MPQRLLEGPTIVDQFPYGSLRGRTRIRISFDSVHLIGFSSRAQEG